MDTKHQWQNWVKSWLLQHVNVSEYNSLISQHSFCVLQFSDLKRGMLFLF